LGFTLSKDPKVRYSPAEEKVFEIISAYKKPVTTKVVIQDYFGPFGEVPYHAKDITGSNIRSLRRKVSVNQEPFNIERVKVPGKPVGWTLKKRAIAKRARTKKAATKSAADSKKGRAALSAA
jgi:hypothetical protein